MSIKALIKTTCESKMFYNSIWAIFGSFISKFLNFGAFLLIARNLGPNLFGTFNVIQTTVGMFGTVAGLGMGLAATKLVAEWKVKNNDITGQIISDLYILSFCFGIVVTSITLVFSYWVSASLLDNSSLFPLLQIMSGVILFDSVNGVQNGILTGMEEYKLLTKINFYTGILGAAFLVVGTSYFGIDGLVWSMFVFRATTCIFTYIVIKLETRKKEIVVRMSSKLKHLGKIFKVGLPTFLTNLTTTPVSWICTTLFASQPMGYQHLGNYNATNQLRQFVAFLPDSAGRIAIPRLAGSHAASDTKTFNKMAIKSTMFNFALSVIPAIFVFLVSPLFISYMGEGYMISQELITTVLVTGILVAVTNSVGYIFICSNLSWFDFGMRIGWAIAVLISSLLLKHKGSIGFASSFLIGSFAYLALQLLFLVYINLIRKT